MNKIALISLGCSKNQVDAERMLGCLKNGGFEFTPCAEDADIVIVNTCGFIEAAKAEAIENILEMVQLKNEGRVKGIIVSGCMAERYKDEIKNELPEVDAVIGIGSIEEISEACRAVLADREFISFGPKEGCAKGGERVLSTPFYTAYLKIADGCDNSCSYCAIPAIRGKFISRPMQELVAEAEQLAEKGVTELTLIAQDTTRYGEDLYGKPALAELLKQLCRIEKLHWIRVLYCYAERITDELIQTLKTEEKIVKYLDIPIQHGSDRVLKMMNRRDNKAGIIALVKKLRENIPGIVLRTTVMVGFPGETKEDFIELCELLRLLKFDRLGVFAFSSEEGTAAALLSDSVTKRTKERRAEIVMSEQAVRAGIKNETKLGEIIEVLVEGFDKLAGCFFGRSAADAPEVDGKVFFTADVKPVEGQYIKVKINEVVDYDLFGERV